MAKKPHSDAGDHSEAPKEEAAKSDDPRTRIVDALLTLPASGAFEDITIRDVCAAANVSLADFRDLFVSKGAVLAAFSGASTARCLLTRATRWRRKLRANGCSTC